MSDVENIVHVDFTVLPPTSVICSLAGMLDGAGRPRYFACVNPHSVMMAGRDAEFAAALAASDCNTADGIGIVIASRLLGGCIRERVCGPDLFEWLCEKLNSERPGTRMFFLGTTRSTLDELVRCFQADFPNLPVAGTLAPPFKSAFTPKDEEAMIATVNAAQADILWIGLGAPKQEKLAYRIRDRLNVRLIGPVGGVFDFYTGRVKLPPRWMQRAGMIWLYRFCQEPRRLLRRNLDSPLFLLHALTQRLFGGGFRK